MFSSDKLIILQLPVESRRIVEDALARLSAEARLARLRIICYICGEDVRKNILVKGNTSVRLRRCGLKGIALFYIIR